MDNAIDVLAAIGLAAVAAGADYLLHCLSMWILQRRNQRGSNE